MLQVLSHRTRAYIYNANGLQGFLVEEQIIRLLRQAHANFVLKVVTRTQIVDFKELGKELQVQQTRTGMLSLLSRKYPSVYIYVLQKMRRRDEVKEFMKKCAELEKGDPAQYTMYIQGYWNPWLEQQRDAGKLK